MKSFFNKNAASFVLSFLFFIFVSIGLLVGLSAYAEARGLELPAAVIWLLDRLL